MAGARGEGLGWGSRWREEEERIGSYREVTGVTRGTGNTVHDVLKLCGVPGVRDYGVGA